MFTWRQEKKKIYCVSPTENVLLDTQVNILVWLSSYEASVGYKSTLIQFNTVQYWELVWSMWCKCLISGGAAPRDEDKTASARDWIDIQEEPRCSDWLYSCQRYQYMHQLCRCSSMRHHRKPTPYEIQYCDWLGWLQSCKLRCEQV